MGNNSKSSVVYQGKIPGRVKYTFAFGKVCSVACNRNADQCVRICNCIYRFSSDRCEDMWKMAI